MVRYTVFRYTVLRYTVFRCTVVRTFGRGGAAGSRRPTREQRLQRLVEGGRTLPP